MPPRRREAATAAEAAFAARRRRPAGGRRAGARRPRRGRRRHPRGRRGGPAQRDAMRAADAAGRDEERSAERLAAAARRADAAVGARHGGAGRGGRAGRAPRGRGARHADQLTAAHQEIDLRRGELAESVAVRRADRAAAGERADRSRADRDRHAHGPTSPRAARRRPAPARPRSSRWRRSCLLPCRPGGCRRAGRGAACARAGGAGAPRAARRRARRRHERGLRARAGAAARRACGVRPRHAARGRGRARRGAARRAGAPAGRDRRTRRSAAPVERIEPLAADEEATLAHKIERLERRREQLGAVNPLAQQEYEEAKGRHDETSEQIADLEGSLRELRRLIRDLTATITERFDETYAEVERNFAQVITTLFPGGRGRLRLVEPELRLAADGEESEAPEIAVASSEPGVELRGDAGRQADHAPGDAVGRREGARGDRLPVRDHAGPAVPVLRARRGRRRARRRQRRAVPDARRPLPRAGAVHRRSRTRSARWRGRLLYGVTRAATASRRSSRGACRAIDREAFDAGTDVIDYSEMFIGALRRRGARRGAPEERAPRAVPPAAREPVDQPQGARADPTIAFDPADDAVGGARGGAAAGRLRRAGHRRDRRAPRGRGGRGRPATSATDGGAAQASSPSCSRLRVAHRPTARPDRGPGGRRQRHRQDDDRRQARRARPPRGRLGRRRRRRHVPGRRGRAARDLGAAGGRRLRRSVHGQDPARSPTTRSRRRVAGPRRRHHRHGRPAAHADEPDGGAGQGAPRDHAEDPGGAARDVARGGRHDGPERPPAGAPVRQAVPSRASR